MGPAVASAGAIATAGEIGLNVALCRRRDAMVSILALDATADACSVALLSGGELREQFRVAPREHAALLLPMVETVLAEAGLVLGELDALAFGRGPGAFTGLRVAAAAAQGLAFGAGLPVVPVSSLAALARGAARKRACSLVLAAADARMDEIYFGAFRIDDGEPVACGAEQVVRPELCIAPAAAMAVAGGVLGAGSGWRYRERMLQLTGLVDAVDEAAATAAGDVAMLAAAAFARGESGEALEALPVYLRNEVAWKPATGGKA